MLSYQTDVMGSNGRMPRIRTCLRVREDSERWCLVWLTDAEQDWSRAEPVNQALQLASLASPSAAVPTGWWLVRSGVLDRLAGTNGR